MARIVVEHEDFELQISCSSYELLYDKAKKNIGESALWAKYSFSKTVDVSFYETEDLHNGKPLKTQAFFFENTDYGVFFKAKESATEPKAAFASKSLEKRMQRFGKDILAGTLNFGNNIGKFDFVFTYNKNGLEQRFLFAIAILSMKLDYHQDWAALVEEIETEHQTLALDFLKETYHTFDFSSNAIPKDQTADMIWWSIFKTFQDQFVKACKYIISRPRRKRRYQEAFLRADQLHHLSPSQENEFAENHQDQLHLYYSKTEVNSNDTPENQFLKMVVNQVQKRYTELSNYLLNQTKISNSAKKDICTMSTTLKSIKENKFFKGIGSFKGLKQESLILHRATGYSTIYRIWALLKMMYALNGDRMRLETKDIATLYEIWCFIRIKNAVSLLTGVKESAKKELENYVYRLFTGKDSQIVFKDESGLELAEISYNSSVKANIADGLQDTVAPTADIAPESKSAERPDIVLRLTKSFGDNHQYKVTYLFDAKYRVQGRYNCGTYAGVDYPPQDAIDQMHRYRDAIYYKQENTKGPLKKEIVGGYVLFPGNGERTSVESAPFVQTKNEVNIGAFPLRPGINPSNEILRDFLDSLLNKSEWASHLENVIAQKGMVQIPENSIATAELTDQVIVAKKYPENFIQVVRKNKVLPWDAASCKSPDKVGLIIFPITNNAAVFKVTKNKPPQNNISWDNIKQMYPDFAHFKLPFNNYCIWNIEEIEASSSKTFLNSQKN